MKLWIVEQGQYVEYQRLGKCNQCRACCCTREIHSKSQAASDDGEDDDTAESGDLSAFEGYSVFWAQRLWWYMKTETLATVREKPCSGFVGGLCTVWQTDEWPAICRYWPVHPNDLAAFPECGFRFERKKDESQSSG